MITYILATDGGCAPNPGPGACGYVLRTYDGNHLLRQEMMTGALADTTNNLAELNAVYLGLLRVWNLAAMEADTQRCILVTDSTNVVGWVSGNFRINNPGIKVKVNEIHSVYYKLTQDVPLTFELVRGHMTPTNLYEELNVQCDEAVTAMRKAMPLAL
jgi:ribonuclease HI